MKWRAVTASLNSTPGSKSGKGDFVANDRKLTDRREFLQLVGLTSAAAMLDSSIAKALAIPANNRTGTLKDVEHIVILMQENNSFDEMFGTLRGVRGFSDPRAVKQTNGNSVFLQPAAPTFGAAASGYVENGVTYGWPANQYGGVTADLVVPPFQINASAATAANAPSATLPADNLNLVYRPTLDHSWPLGTEARNGGEWDAWVPAKDPLTMAYRQRPDVPYHRALADAFTVGDNYFCSFRGPTTVNRCYLWTGCTGNIPGNVLPDGTPTAQGTNGHGGGIVVNNGYVDGYPLAWPTYPEMLQTAGVSWRIYQDIVGDSVTTPTVVTNDWGSGPIPTNSSGEPVCNGSFVGTYTDNPVLYFQQYVTAPTDSPLFQHAATGTALAYNTPALTAPRAAWETWAEGLFAQFKDDVKNGTLPQVSWLVAPFGYCEHPRYPNGYGAWYISQVLDILTANPEVFSKTVFIINYDENDGSFDHLPAPVPAISTDGSDGATTITADYERVPGSPALPIGFGFRVPFLVISPWSKGGYVNSELSDHTSVIRFIEKRFGVKCPNISPWRRAVTSDLTSFFNFADPNTRVPQLPDTSAWLPEELGSGDGSSLIPSSVSQITLGIPKQEQGVRPARALPYDLEVSAEVNASAGTVTLTFINTGRKAAVFSVRSVNAADQVRAYTVESGKSLSGTWDISAVYGLSVYGPNGFLRQFNGSNDESAAALGVTVTHGFGGCGSLVLQIANLTKNKASVTVTDAYTGVIMPALFTRHGEEFVYDWSLEEFRGWYDLVITVEQDPTFQYRFAGHIETGRESITDPAMGGLVALKVPV
jgi:phospholipase C